MLKNKVQQLIDGNKEQIIHFGDALFSTPELGFKEFKTKELIIAYLSKHGIEVENEYFETGFEVSIGNNEGPCIGLICELDAIVTEGHPQSDSVSHAAHSCAHSVQVAIMVNALIALKQAGLSEQLNGKIKLFFTPAEEFCDIDYRKSLISKGKIRYLSGKENMLVTHRFDDCDCIISTHGMGQYRGHKFCVQSELAGFIYKKFSFAGKASHAAVCPELGVNALNAFALFQSAVGMLRETFVETDKCKIHGIITAGGDTVNSIPASVVYEGYVRSLSPQALLKLNDQLTNTAMHCAMALNATCIIEDTPGYLPCIQNELISKVIYENMLSFSEEKQILTTERSMAAGDIGDVSAFIPTVQFGFTGFSGVMHGKDLCIINNEEAYIEPTKIVAMTMIDLLANSALMAEIKKEFNPSMDHEKYLKYLEG